MSAPPIPFVWDGEVFRPRQGYVKICDSHFVVGATHTLVEHEDRSASSHRHYFACINEAWMNLPDHLAQQFTSPEALRKFALVRAGYADSRTIVASSKAEAQRMAAFVRPLDTFAVVTVSDAAVTVWAARSQSARAMGKRDFQESKDKVLDVIAALIGTDPTTLAAHAGQA